MNLILKGYWSNNPISIDEVIQNPELVLRVPVGMVTIPAGVDKAYVDEQDSLLGNEFATALQALDDKKANATAVTQALSTKADLVGGVIPSYQLPSYVDVLNFPDLASFPVVGEDGKIYIAEDVNKTYRWGGSSYVEIGGGGVALGETSSTAYRGDNGKIAYDHSQSQGNPHNTTTSEIAEGTNKYFTESRVNQTVLTGLDTSTASPALATDNLLAAIGKLQAQINGVSPPVWVKAADIGTVHPNFDLTNLEFARINGTLRMRGWITVLKITVSNTAIFTITNVNYKIKRPLTTAGSTVESGILNYIADSATIVGLRLRVTNTCVDATTAATSTQAIYTNSTMAITTHPYMPYGVDYVGQLVI